MEGLGEEGLEHDQLAYYEECKGDLDHIGKSQACGLGRERCNGDRYARDNPIPDVGGGVTLRLLEILIPMFDSIEST